MPSGKTSAKQDSKMFECDKCPYTTVHRGRVIQHMKQVHEKFRSHVCEECGYGAYNKADMRSHMIGVHKSEQKKFKCNQCSYVSAYRTSVHRHKRSVHLKVKKHACNDCGYAAFEKRDLEEHKQSKHIKGEKRYKCIKCPYETHFRASLSTHVKIKHLKNWLLVSDKVKACHYLRVPVAE